MLSYYSSWSPRLIFLLPLSTFSFLYPTWLTFRINMSVSGVSSLLLSQMTNYHIYIPIHYYSCTFQTIQFLSFRGQGHLENHVAISPSCWLLHLSSFPLPFLWWVIRKICCLLKHRVVKLIFMTIGSSLSFLALSTTNIVVFLYGILVKKTFSILICYY